MLKKVEVKSLDVILLLIVMMPKALGEDYSRWSYNDLRQTAMEMQAKGNYGGAFKFFDMAVHAEPNNPEGYLNRGAVFELMHDKEHAIEDERRALALAQSSSKDNIWVRSLAHQNLSGIYLDHDQMDAAETEARTAVGIDPTDPNAQEHLANVLIKIGRRSDAVAFLEKAEQGYGRWKDSVSVSRVKEKISQLQGK